MKLMKLTNAYNGRALYINPLKVVSFEASGGIDGTFFNLGGMDCAQVVESPETVSKIFALAMEKDEVKADDHHESTEELPV